MDREAQLAKYYAGIADIVTKFLADCEKYIKPEAERLGYDPIHMYQKYITMRHYFSLRAQQMTAVAASEDAGWPVLLSGATVRRWAQDFVSVRAADEDEEGGDGEVRAHPPVVGPPARHRAHRTAKPTPPTTAVTLLTPRQAKIPYTFSPYRVGSHVTWLLHDEATAMKARKWIGENAEKKGEAAMTVESFRRFLSGTWDEQKGEWKEKGLLSDVLERHNKTRLSSSTAHSYLKRLGFSLQLRKQAVYVDGFDRPDVVEYRMETYLPRQVRTARPRRRALNRNKARERAPVHSTQRAAHRGRAQHARPRQRAATRAAAACACVQIEIERRSYLWVPQKWLEVAENWPTPDHHRTWVAEGSCTWLPKFHAPCNAIEYVWGNGKARNRETCDFKMSTLRRSAYRAMFSTEPETVRKYFRKARNYQGALREGADAFGVSKRVAGMKKDRYTSHRRPAASQFREE